jgi:telomere length regulation protein
MQLPADVASNWLACFPFSAQKYVYDVFFVHGFVTEVLQILVPFLQQNRSDDLDINVVISNSERYDMNVHIVLSRKLIFICL